MAIKSDKSVRMSKYEKVLIVINYQGKCKIFSDAPILDEDA